MAVSKPVKTPVKRDYTVLLDGWIAGAHREKGTTITLPENVAKYEVTSGKLEVKKATRSKAASKNAAKD